MSYESERIETIRVEKVSEARVKIIVDDHNIIQELANYFSVKVEGYQFMPKYKMGMWNGKIYFFTDSTLPIGLLTKLGKFAESGGYNLDIGFNDAIAASTYSKIDFAHFIDYLNIPDKFEYRDYQFKAAYDAICNKRLSIKATTASGKSLIMYYIIRFMESAGFKSLVVVPSTHLVGQMYTDWEDYGWENIHEYVAQVYGGMPKRFDTPTVISTWHSLFEKRKVGKTFQVKLRNKKLFESFDCLMMDEAHTVKATSLKDIAAACTKAQWRIGLSGTFPEEGELDWFTIVGSLGDIVPYTTYQSLRKEEKIAHLTIQNIMFDYTTQERKANFLENGKYYPGEVNYVNELEKRNEFIVRMADAFETNTIILFTKIDHGLTLYRMLQDTDRPIFHIDGSTSADERNLIRGRMEKRDGIILVASYGTFSTGVNLKNVHQIIAASNYKKFYKVVQAIGRGLRKIKGKKEVITMYNLVDDLRYVISGDSTYINYLYKHYKDRRRVYKNEGYDDISDIKVRLT